VQGLKKISSACCLWLAQGFGSGRIPFAPGTFGSLVGLLWFALLLKTGCIWGYTIGMLIGIPVSFYFCGQGEKILKQTDPGSIVLDEIVALPVCFFSFVALAWFRHKHWPALEEFFAGSGWIRTGVVFALFRVFDIVKPWPVRGSQKLAGGWGVTVDDILAGVYVALVVTPWAW
jgi:phosphatidylglycerophosphatase A